MDTKEYEKIKTDILNGKISPEKAAEIIYANKTRSWQKDEWKQRRAELIKDYCEQCNTHDGTFVLQHTWHPRDYRDIKRELVSKYGKIVNDEFTIDELISEEEVLDFYDNIQKETRTVCPNCYSYNVSERKTKEIKYRCNHCKIETNELVDIKIPVFIDDRVNEVPSKKRNVETYTSIAWDIYKDKCKARLFDRFGQDIEKETILAVIDDSIRYISLVDTVTFCKKCAFLYDKQGKDLCKVCNKEYKYIGMDMCYKCRNVQ